MVASVMFPVRPYLPIPPMTHLPPLLTQAVFFIALLAVASAFDIRKRIIPNTVCAGIALTGLINFSPANLFGILAALPLLIAALCKQGGIGGGDIKLTAACGLVLGFECGIFGLLIGLAAMLLFYAGHCVIGRIRKNGKTAENKALPMAPFLSIGFIAIYMLNIAVT